jgi:hypothetical protein
MFWEAFVLMLLLFKYQFLLPTNTECGCRNGYSGGDDRCFVFIKLSSTLQKKREKDNLPPELKENKWREPSLWVPNDNLFPKL